VAELSSPILEILRYTTNMDTKLLIDAIVQQTTILIAQLSIAAGIRAPLSHLADQIFVDLAKEIERQGVSKKVAADMFGMALRGYQRRVQRASESASVRNRTLWEAVYDFVSEQGNVSRERISERFRYDSADDVGAVLADLAANGLIYCAGRGQGALYRLVTPADRRENGTQDDLQNAQSLVWVTVYRARSLRLSELQNTFALPKDKLRSMVDCLVKENRLSIAEPGDDPLLSASAFIVPVGSSQGWEGAVFDHFIAVATAIAAKVNQGPGAKHNDQVGGATLSFDVHSEHPYRLEVLGLLERMRKEVNTLWDKVVAYNQAHRVPDEEKERVSFYFGQSVEPPASAYEGEEKKRSDL
jgi:hypothetical protein